MVQWEREQIGDCTLYRGDCQEILPSLGMVDAVVTDPPYGVGLRVKKNAARTKGYVHPASTTYADEPASVLLLLGSTLPMLQKQSRRMAIFPGPKLLHDYPRPASIGGVYLGNGAGHDPWGFSCFHPILYYGKCPYGAQRPNSFSDYAPGECGIDHPCPKPLRWMLWLVNRASLPGETVLDPFMGSGTTGIACAQLGRTFIGIEIEPLYFDLACHRIEEAQRQGDFFTRSTLVRHEQLALPGGD